MVLVVLAGVDVASYRVALWGGGQGGGPSASLICSVPLEDGSPLCTSVFLSLKWTQGE